MFSLKMSFLYIMELVVSSFNIRDNSYLLVTKNTNLLLQSMINSLLLLLLYLIRIYFNKVVDKILLYKKIFTNIQLTCSHYFTYLLI